MFKNYVSLYLKDMKKFINKLPWVAVLFLGLFVFILWNKNRKYESEVSKIQTEIPLLNEANEKYKKIIAFFYLNEGKEIPDEICIDESGHKLNLSELLGAFEKILVFKYTSINCSSCVDSALSKLSSANNIGRIIIISDFPSVSSMKSLKNRYPLNNATFLISKTIDYNETPAVFLTGKTMKITKFLIINQKDNVLENYLKQL